MSKLVARKMYNSYEYIHNVIKMDRRKKIQIAKNSRRRFDKILEFVALNSDEVSLKIIKSELENISIDKQWEAKHYSRIKEIFNEIEMVFKVKL